MSAEDVGSNSLKRGLNFIDILTREFTFLQWRGACVRACSLESQLPWDISLPDFSLHATAFPLVMVSWRILLTYLLIFRLSRFLPLYNIKWCFHELCKPGSIKLWASRPHISSPLSWLFKKYYDTHFLFHQLSLSLSEFDFTVWYMDFITVNFSIWLISIYHTWYFPLF